ncbi:thiopurine S-methyltransferase [Oscillatoriales cyanobacterium USR001]|nr:thiopurine S-methyltransferase [Oscillatoriales cyanobacterium USR001]
MNQDRVYARNLAMQFRNAGKPMEWFEVLYAQGKDGKAVIPWAEMSPNPNLIQWLDAQQIRGEGKTALTVGCGLGDDVEELSWRGFHVVGFDISASAIEWCKNRFPNSNAQYIAADVLNTPESWNQGFDLVLESYTLQALPRSLREKAIEKIANFVAFGGQLLVICRGRDVEEDAGEIPEPLTRDEVMKFVDLGLLLESFEDYLDDESPPVRRFRIEFKKV